LFPKESEECKAIENSPLNCQDIFIFVPAFVRNNKTKTKERLIPSLSAKRLLAHRLTSLIIFLVIATIYRNLTALLGRQQVTKAQQQHHDYYYYIDTTYFYRSTPHHVFSRLSGKAVCCRVAKDQAVATKPCSVYGIFLGSIQL
jgi:Fe2+ or Zn2+ uptake regulation protein